MFPQCSYFYGGKIPFFPFFSPKFSTGERVGGVREVILNQLISYIPVGGRVVSFFFFLMNFA